MKHKTALFQVQGPGGKRDAKNNKIAGKIAEMVASHQGHEGREEGAEAVVTAGSMELGAWSEGWITDGFQLLFLVFISPFQENRENGGSQGVFSRRKPFPRSEIRKINKSWEKS